MLMTSCFVCATLNLGRKKSTGTEPMLRCKQMAWECLYFNLDDFRDRLLAFMFCLFYARLIFKVLA